MCVYTYIDPLQWHKQVGRDVDETIRLIQAFKYTDEHGEVCPAGWKPGKPTMVDDVKTSLEYFSKVN